MTQKPKISAFVISYNRENIIHTCLSGLQFVDELILVDKSSTDRTVEIATPLVDKVVVVPWTPTADDTRQYAETLCSHEWILFLDDDECLNIDAIKFIERELKNPRAKYYKFPLRHYICGIHSENAYYWPESHIRLYKKGAISFQYKIHDYIQKNSDEFYEIPIDSGPCIHHFSHKNVQEWIEKCNRYTSEPRRHRMSDPESGNDLVLYAHKAIDRWIGRSRVNKEGEYESVVALLRATYDIIDRLKCWEEENFINGARLFLDECAILEQSYLKLDSLSQKGFIRTGDFELLNSDSIIATHSGGSHKKEEIGYGSLIALNDELKAQREALQVIQKRLEEERDSHKHTYRSYSEMNTDLANQVKSANESMRTLNLAYQSSLSWKITKPLRNLTNFTRTSSVFLKSFFKKKIYSP